MAKKPLRSGRPAGAKNIAHVLDVQPTQCPQCGSTEKTYTGSRTVQDYAGLLDGQPYNRIVRRRCVCSTCDQTRIERSFEFEPEKE